MKAEIVQNLVTLGLYILGFSLIASVSSTIAWGLFFVFWANNIEAKSRNKAANTIDAFIDKLRNK